MQLYALSRGLLDLLFLLGDSLVDFIQTSDFDIARIGKLAERLNLLSQQVSGIPAFRDLHRNID
jgi:hypothetical protein